MRPSAVIQTANDGLNDGRVQRSRNQKGRTTLLKQFIPGLCNDLRLGPAQEVLPSLNAGVEEGSKVSLLF